ncbi:hypothetical protein Thiowin_03395 [Thiorhodovibrio winogradskyi]|uniref:Tetratricopeptide repeat protein n=1 Tax=Thiorhodovibrio winogradskyi TaxID=77007 RepID=A0ABZ0SCP8_9GAMM|nr:hypothetical protein [Thiorhodovibrio winogradskyi]
MFRNESKIKAHLYLHQLFVAVIFVGILGVVWVTYQPAIPGAFMLDDFDNLGALGKSPVESWSSLLTYLAIGNAGPLGRPLSKLSFLINDNAWPSHPASFKQTNLFIHLLIGVLVFAISRLLLKPFVAQNAGDWIAIVATSLWLLHPLQVSTVMYVVQRMTQLATLFVLAGVAGHVMIRTQINNIETRYLLLLTLSVIVFTILAMLSKESGVLLPLYLFVIEFTLLSSLAVNANFVWWRRIFLLVPTIALIGYLAYLPRWLSGYASRDFSLEQRLLTEPVVLMDYLYHLISMRVVGLGLFQDDFPIYTSIFTMPVLFASLALAFIIIFSIAFHKRFPLVSFAVLWFLGGHLLESTTIGLELYFEHRNYLPILGPLLSLSAGVYLGLKRVKELSRFLAPAVGVCLILIASFVTRGYAREWGALEQLYSLWAIEHPESPRAQRTLATVFVAMGDITTALRVLDDGYAQFPDDLTFPIMSLDIACRFDRPVQYNIDDLINRINQHRWTDGLRPALSQLFDGIDETQCREMISEIHRLTPALANLSGVEKRSRLLAGFYVMDGELAMRQENWNKALDSFLKVEELAPSADSALRIAGFFMRAREFKLARVALEDAAMRANNRRRWYSPNLEDQYRDQMDKLDILIEATNSAPEQ